MNSDRQSGRCGRAPLRPGRHVEILIDNSACVEIEANARFDAVGALNQKGIEMPVETFRAVGLAY